MRQVEDLLVIRVRVDGRHEALLDRVVDVQDLCERRDAVRRAGRVGDDVVLLGVVHVVVDAENDGEVGIGRGRGDDYLLRAGVDVLLRAVPVGEEAGRLDHELDLEVLPRQPGRVALGEDLELGLAGLDDAVADLDILVELPEDGVVLQQVPHRLRVAEVVDRHDVEVAATLEVSAEEVPPNPPKSVDPHACLRHRSSLTPLHLCRRPSPSVAMPT